MIISKMFPIFNKIRVLDDTSFVNTYVMNIPTLKSVIDFNGIRYKFIVSSMSKEPYFNFLNEIKDLFEKYNGKLNDEESHNNFENELETINNKYRDQLFIFKNSFEPAPKIVGKE